MARLRLTFVASAALLLGINLRLSAPPREVPTGVWTPIREGLHYVRTHRRILQAILLATTYWACAGIVVSVLPAIVRELFGGSFTDIGIYRGLLAAGLAIGAAGLTLIGPALPIPMGVLGGLAGGAFWALVLNAVLMLHGSHYLAGLALVMVGVHGAAILVSVMVIIQRFVPDNRRGRVFGVSDMSTMAAMAAAAGLIGVPHIPQLDRYVPLLLALVVAALFTAFVAAWRLYRRRDPRSVAGPARPGISSTSSRSSGGACAARLRPVHRAATGHVLVAANHTAGIDPLLILAACPHRLVSFIAEQKYYHVPVAKWFMQLDRCVPVDPPTPPKPS